MWVPLHPWEESPQWPIHHQNQQGAQMFHRRLTGTLLATLEHQHQSTNSWAPVGVVVTKCKFSWSLSYYFFPQFDSKTVLNGFWAGIWVSTEHSNSIMFLTNYISFLKICVYICTYQQHLLLMFSEPWAFSLLVHVLHSFSNLVLFLHLQAWLTEIHEYAQQDVVIMLLGNKVRTLSPKWADLRTDGLRGREGRHCHFWIKPLPLFRLIH